jgi:hypothetical protein
MQKHQIYQLRQVELDPSVAAKLWPFLNAYRDHDPAPTWRELQAEGLERIDEDSVMDFIVDQRDYERELAEA